MLACGDKKLQRHDGLDKSTAAVASRVKVQERARAHKKFQKINCVNQLLAAESRQLHTMDSDLVEEGG
jgi:hypothetical protein